MATIDPAFLDHTIAMWQPLSAKPLSREDAREIIENAVGFYGTLMRWTREVETSEPSSGGAHGRPAA